MPHTRSWYEKMPGLYLQDANGPSAEALLSYSDLTLLLILPFALGIILFLPSLLTLTPLYRSFSEHQALEFTWTFLPAFLLFMLAFPSLSLLYLLDEAGVAATTTKVIGHQWF